MEKHTTSTSRITICLVTILILGAPTARGERLKAKLEFEPKTVVPFVTLKLALKCTLVPANSSDEGGVIDVKSVAGVNMKQRNADDDFETVASVSYSDQYVPKLWGYWDDKRNAIDADVHNNSRLLEVIVSDPTVNHTGNMCCEIFVNDDEGTKTLFDEDKIRYQEPDNKIFLNELRRLKIRDEAQQQEISAQQQEISAQQQEISAQQQNNSVQQQEIVSQLNELRRLRLRDEAQQQEIVSQIKKLHEAEEDIKDNKREILDLKAKNVVLTKHIEEMNTYMSTKVSFSAVRREASNGGGFFVGYSGVSPWTVIKFNKAFVNQGGGYDTSTGVFTCPVNGTYYFSYDLLVLYVEDGTTEAAAQLLLNDDPVTWSYTRDEDKASQTFAVIGGRIGLQLKKGDKVKVRNGYYNSNYWFNTGSGYGSMFSGYLIK